MKARRTIWNLQALRALAALGVVVYHSVITADDYGMQPHFTIPVGHIGPSGVDIFFIISGFVMVFVTPNDAAGLKSGARFLRDRIRRIVPTYWIFTTLWACLVLAVPGAFRVFEFSIGHAVRSYLFLPSETTPFVHVGWTLNLEMFFYVMFAGALVVVGKSKGPWILAAVIVSRWFMKNSFLIHIPLGFST